MAVKQVAWPSPADEKVEGFEPGMRTVGVVGSEGRGVGDEDVEPPSAQSIPEKCGKHGEGAETGLALGVLVYAVGSVADGAAEPGHGQAAIAGQAQVEVGASFCARDGMVLVVFWVMVAGYVVERHVDHAKQIFEVVVGKVSTGEDQRSVFEMPLGCKRVDAVYNLIADSKDLHGGGIVPYIASLCKGFQI